jgi:hypothetical protein
MSKKKTEILVDHAQPGADKTVETAIAVAQPAGLPTVAKASDEVTSRMAEVQDNLESIESFKLPRAKMTASGIELVEGFEPSLVLEGVIVHTKKTNVYYKDAFNPNDVTPPTCFSNDGVRPDKSIEKPVNSTCNGCPMAEFGTNSMKSGKACRNLKPVYMLLNTDEGISLMPRQLTITPASLKAANAFLTDLTAAGISYRKVQTRVTLFKETPKDTYFKMKFSIAKKLTPQEIADVEFLRDKWRPIMDAQIVDQREFDTGGGQAAPMDSKGEF